MSKLLKLPTKGIMAERKAELACQINRFNLQADHLESRLPSVDSHNGISVSDPFGKQWQTTECTHCQEYQEQSREAGSDCHILKEMNA